MNAGESKRIRGHPRRLTFHRPLMKRNDVSFLSHSSFIFSHVFIAALNFSGANLNASRVAFLYLLESAESIQSGKV